MNRAHPLLDCYRFHGFSLSRVSRSVLAAGVLADEVVYRRPDGATWHVLSWQWPVRSSGGDGGPLASAAPRPTPAKEAP